MQMFLSDDPNNKAQHRLVLRGHSHRRLRRDDSRYNSPITATLQDRSIREDYDLNYYEKEEDVIANYIGNTWAIKYNKSDLPSLEQIDEGITEEALVQLKQSMWDVQSVQVQENAKTQMKETLR